MPKRKGHFPAYRLHKASGQARVIVDGEHLYLGEFDSPESRERYARLITELSRDGQSNGRPARAADPADSISVNALILHYWQFAQGYYSKDGEPTKELACMREALRPLRELYGPSPAVEFGPCFRAWPQSSK